MASCASSSDTSSTSVDLADSSAPTTGATIVAQPATTVEEIDTIEAHLGDEAIPIALELVDSLRVGDNETEPAARSVVAGSTITTVTIEQRFDDLPIVGTERGLAVTSEGKVLELGEARPSGFRRGLAT